MAAAVAAAGAAGVLAAAAHAAQPGGTAAAQPQGNAAGRTAVAPAAPGGPGGTTATGAAPAARAAAGRGAGCLIEPDRWADIGSPVVGVVDHVAVERGERVARGQPLVQLRAAVETAAQAVAETRARTEAEVLAAQTAVELAASKLGRAESLEAERFISPQALEQVRAELELARHRLEQARSQQRIWAEESRVAQAQLAQRTVRSPFAGVVVDRYTNPGERVEDRPLLRVAVVDPLRVELMVPVAQWGRLNVGDSVAVQPELPGAAPVQARVAQVDGVLDAASNTFRVRLSLPNPGQRLPAGLRCKADLETLAPAMRPATPQQPPAPTPAPASAAAPTTAPTTAQAPAPATGPARTPAVVAQR